MCVQLCVSGQEINSSHSKFVSGFSFGVFQMGACFSKVFDGCPLKINCATSWIHPDTKGKAILGLVMGLGKKVTHEVILGLHLKPPKVGRE